MSGDKSLQDLLKWSIENSAVSADNPPDATAEDPDRKPTQLNADMIKALMGGPSDADLMKGAVEHILSPPTQGGGDDGEQVTDESRLQAFDNLEQLIENLDNANLLAKLGLWTPLLALLGHPDPRFRRMAAWVVGTAVQNNEPCQERFAALGGVERLVAMTLGRRVSGEEDTGEAKKSSDEEEEGVEDAKDVRKKAAYALSSAVRNYQPAMDACTAELARRGETGALAAQTDAQDMDAVDAVIGGLRERINAA